MSEIELAVEKVRRAAADDDDDDDDGPGASTLSSACTSATFSSASTLCASDLTAVEARNPDLAEVFVTLYEQGVEVLGADGMVDAMVAQSQRGPVRSLRGL
jgi:hypothetical protein